MLPAGVEELRACRLIAAGVDVEHTRDMGAVVRVRVIVMPRAIDIVPRFRPLVSACIRAHNVLGRSQRNTRHLRILRSACVQGKKEEDCWRSGWQ